MTTPLGLLAQTGAHASWEPATAALWRTLVLCALALLALAWIVRALLRARRYAAVDLLAETERRRVRETIAAAERRTTGELVTVVLERSDAHTSALLAAGVVFALLAGLACGLGFVVVPPLALVGVLAGAFGAGVGLAAWLPDLARSLVSEAAATRAAAEQALVEFQTQKLHETRERTGVLIFVSLFERRVIVLGDEGIHAKVGDAQWARARDLVLDGVVQGRLCAGLVAAIEECASVLERNFPASPGDVNELPDHLVVR